MPLAVERSIVKDRDLAVRLWGNGGGDAAPGKRIAEPVGVIASIPEQALALGKASIIGAPFIVAHLPFAQRQDRRTALAVGDRVKLRAQAALGMSDTSGNMPFLSRLAAARCAFRWVASIINWSGLPALAASAAKILLNTPSRLQRMKRLYIVLSGPYSAGASRQRRPFLITKMMPLMIRRSSTGGTPCHSGKYGSIRRICASDNQIKSLMSAPPSHRH